MEWDPPNRGDGASGGKSSGGIEGENLEMGLFLPSRGEGDGGSTYDPYLDSACGSRVKRFSKAVGLHFRSLEDGDVKMEQEQVEYMETPPHPHTDLGVPTGDVQDDGVRGEHWTRGDGGGSIGVWDGEVMREERKVPSLGVPWKSSKFASW
jgi:hypothetical protein